MEIQLLEARDVLTMTSAQGDCVAVFADRIVAVGSRSELRERFPFAKRIDLGEAVILPGFIDPHMHPARAAEYHIHAHIDPETVLNVEQFMSVLRDKAARTEPGKLVRGVRYDEVRATGGRLVTRSDLDTISDDHPVLVTHFTGHIGIANSRALEMFGINEETSPPPGGQFGRDDSGRLNGHLYGAAIQTLLPKLPELSMDEKLDGLATVQRLFHAAGLTSVTDAIATPPIIELFQEAERRGLLSLRIGLLIWHTFYDKARELGLRTGFGSDKLKWLAVKTVLDGAMSSATALLDQPYEGMDSCGKLVMPADELVKLVQRVHANGDQMAVHANGDRAIAILLDAYAKAQEQDPRPGLRHRVEHASLVNEQLLEEMKRLDVMTVPIMSYIPFHGDKLRRLFGAERSRRMIACRSMLDAGILVAGSSDYGAGPFEPLYAIQGAITRKDNEGVVVGGEQAITVDEALALYTCNAAAVNGEEHEKGKIAPGFFADFVVLDRDPRRTPPEEIASIPIQSTWVGGEQVWAQAR